jgi:DNA-binding CsgD family transcriptional regulator
MPKQPPRSIPLCEAGLFTCKSSQMVSVQAISTLIGDIYDASLDSGLWPEVLKSTCAFVGGASSALLSQDAVRAEGNAFFVWGGSSEYRQKYFSTYMKLDPVLISSQCNADVGEVYSTDMLIPYEEFVESRFFLEWVRPQQLCDSVWSLFEKTATSAAGITVLRHDRDGRVDESTRKRLALLAPHFRRAVAIGKVIDFKKHEASAFKESLGSLAAAVFLLDGTGAPVFANAIADNLLKKGDILRVIGTRITAVDPTGDRAFQGALICAENGAESILPAASAIPLKSREGEQWMAHVLRLTAGARGMLNRASGAVTAVFVRKTELDLPLPLETVSKLFKLTPAESRVLAATMRISGLSEVAAALGLTEATVKTHLQRVFAKTETSRQTDLVKLVASYASPLGSPPA